MATWIACSLFCRHILLKYKGAYPTFHRSLAVVGVTAQHVSHGTSTVLSSALTGRWYEGALAAFERILTSNVFSRLDSLVPWPSSLLEEPKSLLGFISISSFLLGAHAAATRLILTQVEEARVNFFQHLTRILLVVYLLFRYSLLKMKESMFLETATATGDHPSHPREHVAGDEDEDDDHHMTADAEL